MLVEDGSLHRAAQQGVLREQLNEAKSEMETLSAAHQEQLVRIAY